MNSPEQNTEPSGRVGAIAALRNSFLPGIVWIMGLVSTIYLVGWASFCAYLSFGFGYYSPSTSAWKKVEFIVLYSLPLFCFVTIGFVGLKFWPRGRFRLWGLSAILIQTGCAIASAVYPFGLLIFFDLFERFQ